MATDTLDFIMHEVPLVQYLTTEGYQRPSGPCGSLAYAAWGNNIDGLNITYAKPDDENNFGRNIGNDTWTGFVGQLQRGLRWIWSDKKKSRIQKQSRVGLEVKPDNWIILSQKKDVGLLPGNMVLSPNIVSYIPVADASIGSIISAPETPVRHLDILETLDVLQPTTWLTLLALLLTLPMLYLIKHNSHKAVSLAIDIFRCYTNQHEIKLNLWKSTLVPLTVLLASFIFLVIYENAIHTDIVANDYSKIINCVQDLARLEQYKPYFIENQAFTEMFANSDKPMFKRIWSRVVKKGPKRTVMSFDPTQLPKPEKGKMAFIGKEEYTLGLSRMMCAIGRGAHYEGHSWSAQKPFAELNGAYFIRKDISRRKKEIISKRVHRLAETGLIMGYWKATTKPVPGIPSSYSCSVEKLDNLFPSSEENKVTFHNFKTLSLSFIVIVAIVVIIFVAEICSCK